MLHAAQQTQYMSGLKPVVEQRKWRTCASFAALCSRPARADPCFTARSKAVPPLRSILQDWERRQIGLRKGSRRLFWYQTIASVLSVTWLGVW